MLKLKIALAAVIFMFPIINYGQHTDQINSNRPGETMSAFAVGKSVIQLETGIYGIKENHSLLGTTLEFGLDLTLRYGALLEIRINSRPSISKRRFYDSIE
jgi:hypothetical protein